MVNKWSQEEARFLEEKYFELHGEIEGSIFQEIAERINEKFDTGRTARAIRDKRDRMDLPNLGEIDKDKGQTGEPERPEHLAGMDQDDQKELEDLLCEENYVYNPDNEVYIVFLPSLSQPLSVPESKHKAIKKAYSNWDGNPDTINEVVRSFPFLSRQLFFEYKRVFGWTHDSEPFTKEELMERDAESLAEDAYQLKRQAVYKATEKKKWKETKKDARKWHELETYWKEPLEQLVEENVPNYNPPNINIETSNANDNYILVGSPFDFHFGMDGLDYNRDIAERRLLRNTNELLEKTSQYTTPERIITCLSSDWLHFDDFEGNTTAGTRQDVDGTAPQVLFDANKLVIKYIDALRSLVNDVEIHVVPGNHDYFSSFHMISFLEAWYRNTETVRVVHNEEPRSYCMAGNTSIGFSHGRDEKRSELGMIMVKEAKDQVAECDELVWFVGDKHYEQVADKSGAKIYQLPSLAGTDYWHKKKGFVLQQKAITGYMVHKERGVDATFYSKVNK